MTRLCLDSSWCQCMSQWCQLMHESCIHESWLTWWLIFYDSRFAYPSWVMVLAWTLQLVLMHESVVSILMHESWYMVADFLWSRFAYAPYQLLKSCGIKGPTPVPFFGNYRERMKMVRLCLQPNWNYPWLHVFRMYWSTMNTSVTSMDQFLGTVNYLSRPSDSIGVGMCYEISAIGSMLDSNPSCWSLTWRCSNRLWLKNLTTSVTML